MLHGSCGSNKPSKCPFLASRIAIVRSASSPLVKARCSLVTMLEHISKKWQDFMRRMAWQSPNTDILDIFPKFQVHIITLILILNKSSLNILIIKYHEFLLHLCLAHVIPRISSLRTPLQLAEPPMCRHSSWEIGTTATLQSSLEAPVAGKPTKQNGGCDSSSMVEMHSFQICSPKIHVYMYIYIWYMLCNANYYYIIYL